MLTGGRLSSIFDGLLQDVIIELCAERLPIFHLCLLAQISKSMSHAMMLTMLEDTFCRSCKGLFEIA